MTFLTDVQMLAEYGRFIRCKINDNHEQSLCCYGPSHSKQTSKDLRQQIPTVGSPRRLCQGQKVKHSAKATADGQLAGTFCACRK